MLNSKKRGGLENASYEKMEIYGRPYPEPTAAAPAAPAAAAAAGLGALPVVLPAHVRQRGGGATRAAAPTLVVSSAWRMMLATRVSSDTRVRPTDPSFLELNF